MSQNNFATTEEIKYASTILLNGQEFEDEKIDIIKCNESKDIKACPGSGKTTTLLAKLIVLANQMPLEMNKGICVLTHTNVAINEIKNKLGIKSEILFRYPNHFGTIQSFVDKFLAIPYSSNLKIGRIKKISDDIYYKNLERSFNARINRIKDSELYKKIWYFVLNNTEDNNHWNFLYSIRLGLENGKFEILRDKSNILKFNKPKKKNQKTYTDWTEIEKEEIKTWLIDTITNVHEYYNVISYQDAYLFAKKYLMKIPSLKDAFSERFRYVFIDEMQDTDNYQLDIVNSVFNKSKSIVQQFGDPLQSIYNRVKSEKIWNPKNPLLISSSKRFGNNIGRILKTVCIEPNASLTSNEEINSLQPIIILFNNPKDVLPKYCELINSLQIGDNTIKRQSIIEDKKLKAIGWVGEKNNDSRPENQLTIQSYFDNFKKNLKRSDKVDYNSLQSFLRKQNTSQLKIYSENIFNALLHVLSIGNVKIKKQEIKRSYNKSLLLEKLQIEHPKTYRKLLSDIAIWSKKIHCSETNNLEVLETIKKFILNEFISIFNIPNTNKYLNSFLNNVPEELVTEEELKSNNTYLGLNDISIELGTIHSVKGETHCATLYLETCYFGKHESERIINQLKGRPINSKASIRTKETLKMAYVGMSRPKYLLCLAMHKNRYDNELDIKNGGNWEVIDLTNT